jgi:hypothetical protein
MVARTVDSVLVPPILSSQPGDAAISTLGAEPDYPSQDKPPVVGEKQKDPTHSAIYGLKLAERLKEVGTEVVLAYPGAPKSKYGSITGFLIAKLKDKE